MKLRWTAVLLLTAAACAPGERPPAASELRGWIVDPPIEKADFALESMHGGTFNFREATDGFLTLLFFGYTHCPDICPLHMANIGSVLKKVPPDVANRVKVVFVSTDPERDTAERLRSWLANFHPRFIGVRGPIEDVNAVQAAFGLGASFREDLPDGGYGVAHAAQVIAFTSDNRAHVMYAFGTRQEDWGHDLPMLVKGPPAGG